MKALFPYYGGKGRLASWIISLMPDHKVYVEPYAGSAAVLFAKPKVKTEILNDHDKHLINCYDVWADPRMRRELWRRIVQTPYSRTLYERASRILKGFGDQRPSSREAKIVLAWAYMIQISWSHGSQVRNGFNVPTDGIPSGSGPKAWGKNVGMSTERGTAGKSKARQWGDIADIRARADRLSGVTIECGKSLDVIRKYDTAQAVIYCDPPYPKADQGHYGGKEGERGHFTLAMLQELINVASECKGTVLVSNYKQPGLILPDEWEVFEKEVVLMAAKKAGAKKEKRVEVIYRKLAADASKQLTFF